MKQLIRLFTNHCRVLLLVSAVLAPLSSASAQEKLLVTGTGSAIGVMNLIAKAFEKTTPGVKVEVLPSVGSTGGIKAVKDGKIDVGISSRPMKPEERSQDLMEEAYGRTAFIFAVQASNPIKGLTLQDVANIYSRKMTKWPNGDQIRLILRPQNDAYSKYMATINPEIAAASETSHTLPGVFVGNTDQDAVVQIEKTQGSFGVSSACIVAAEKRKVKSVPLGGKVPSVANVASGAYPYSMSMYLVYRKGSSNPVLKQFIDFIYSSRGQKILSQTEHVLVKRSLARK